VNRITVWTIHASTILVGGTGLVYAWMRYFTAPADEFAIVGHPWQPHVQHLHLWTAPLLVFGVGVIWRDHAWRYYRRQRANRRRTGVSMLLTAAPMIVSGYLIQTAVGDLWRQVWIVVHLAASALFLVGYAAHHVVARASRASPGRRPRWTRAGGPAQPSASAADAP